MSWEAFACAAVAVALVVRCVLLEVFQWGKRD